MGEDDVDPASAVDEDEEMDAFLDEILMWRDDEDEK